MYMIGMFDLGKKKSNVKYIKYIIIIILKCDTIRWSKVLDKLQNNNNIHIQYLYTNNNICNIWIKWTLGGVIFSYYIHKLYPLQWLE